MELVGGLFASVFGGGAAAAATTVVPGIAGAATVVPAASAGLSGLQGFSTLFGVVSSIGSGFAAAGAAEAEAKQHEFASRDEFIAGRETTAALKQELVRTLGNQAVAFAAGGVDLGSVSVGTAKRQAIDDAERELSVASNQALSRSMQRRRAAANARARGRSAIFQSVVDGLGKVAEFGMDVKNRTSEWAVG